MLFSQKLRFVILLAKMGKRMHLFTYIYIYVYILMQWRTISPSLKRDGEFYEVGRIGNLSVGHDSVACCGHSLYPHRSKLKPKRSDIDWICISFVSANEENARYIYIYTCSRLILLDLRPINSRQSDRFGYTHIRLYIIHVHVYALYTWYLV